MSLELRRDRKEDGRKWKKARWGWDCMVVKITRPHGGGDTSRGSEKEAFQRHVNLDAQNQRTGLVYGKQTC